jgi:phosphatidylserine/phosphatidylglycerophosphate/cardiolipin synthase-like enzyme
MTCSVSPIARLALASAVVLAAGCGHTVSRTATRNTYAELPSDAVLSAYVHRDALFLLFRDGDRRSVFEAGWKSSAVEKAGETRFRTAQLTLVDKPPKNVEELRASVREATIVPVQRFRVLLFRIAERLVPAGAGEGVFLALGEREFVAYRDAAGGEVRIVPSAGAPQDVRITRRINPTELAEELFAVVEEAQRETGDPRRLFLVAGERAKRPPAYLLLDLDQRLVVVASWPGSADVAAEQAAAGKGLRTLQAGILEGQVVSLIKNPVSFLGRALNFGAQTVAVMFRRRSWPAPEIPPLMTEGPEMDLPAFDKKLDSMMGSNRYKGSIRLLIDGPAFFPVLERRLDEARESLHFRMCIWDTDDVAVEVADRVRRRSLQIPDTRVIVDRITTLGSGGSPPGTPMPEGFEPPRDIRKYLETDSRVRVRSFLNGMTMGDHSKVILVDRRYALLGGMNLGREYRYEWHDVMVELEGPIVGWYERDFALAWSHASILGDLAYAEAYLTAKKTYEGPAEREDYVELRPIYTKTLNPAILRALKEALRRARRYAWIENPYLYDDTVVRELIAARRRGIDVRVVLPSQADMESTDGNNKVKANRLIANGVRVYAYPGMLHTKAALIDGWSLIGSCNFNKLSLRMNFEANVATSDPKFAEEMKRDLFETDFARSRELTEPLAVTGSDRVAEWLAHQM